MIWVTQYLCPDRHALFALAWDDNEMSQASVEAEGEKMFTENGGPLNRWCELCGGAPHVEHQESLFQTMEEAMPTLKQVESENIRTRDFVLGMRN